MAGVGLDHMPYMASMLFALRCSNLPGLGTFAVDRRMRLYIDFDHLAGDPETWTDTLCAQALLHECCHVFHDHADRAVDAGVSPADWRRWGASADAEINDDLRDARCRELADFGVFPATLGQPDHRCAEEYYAATPPPTHRHPHPAAVSARLAGPASPPGVGAVTGRSKDLRDQGVLRPTGRRRGRHHLQPGQYTGPRGTDRRGRRERGSPDH